MARPSTKYDKTFPQTGIDVNSINGDEAPVMAAFAFMGAADYATNGLELCPPGRQKKLLYAWAVMGAAGGAGDTITLKKYTAAAGAGSSGTAVTDSVDVSSKGNTDMFAFGELKSTTISTSQGVYATNASSATALVGILYTYI